MSRHYHLIGIGGIGMSGIAHLLLASGEKISGSDLKPSRITEELKNSGARIFIGHDVKNIEGADTIIYSSAVKEDNPELIAARNNNITLLKRAEALAKLMTAKCVITVAGSHGKTTTTSLASLLLLEAGLSPTVAIGGILRNIDTNARLGNGKYFVAEADESDGSFLNFSPAYSIITNIDKEHLDYYKDFKTELRAFEEFINKTSQNGLLFYSCDDQNLENIVVKLFKGRSLSFGFKKSADIYPQDIKFIGLTSEFDCIYKGKSLGRFQLALGGRHNISNALSVIALGLELGIDLEIIKRVLKDYKGAGRRLEVKFEDDSLTLIDDYAHHPTEIQATLEAVKNLKHQRLVVVFQPHRYTRTKLLLDEFAKAFNSADYVIITDIYPASEPPIEGISGKSIYEKIKKYFPNKEACYLPKAEIITCIQNIVRPKDLILTLGAGDIINISDELVQKFKK